VGATTAFKSYPVMGGVNRRSAEAANAVVVNARQADPKAELYYNDYSLENEAKRKGAVELIRKLQNAGVTVTAVGLQGHDKLDWPTLQQQADTIEAFRAFGIKVNITELDVDVLPRVNRSNSADVSGTSTATASLNPYTAGLPDDMQQKLAARYADLFRIFIKYRGTIDRITFWGVTDGGSWLNNFPVRGRTNYSLLFDRRGQPSRPLWP
jgi:endo-1,4-beta-xylanase